MVPGHNHFTWTVRNQWGAGAGDFCILEKTMTITDNKVIADAGPNDTLCANTTHLAAQDPSTYQTKQGIGHWTTNITGTGVIQTSL